MLGIIAVVLIIGISVFSLHSMDEGSRKVFLTKWRYPIRGAAAMLLSAGGYFSYDEYVYQAERAEQHAEVLAKDSAEVAKVRATLIKALARHGFKPHPKTLFATGRSDIETLKTADPESDDTASKTALYEHMEPSDTKVFQSGDFIPAVSVSTVLPGDSVAFYCTYHIKHKERGLFGGSYDGSRSLTVGGQLIEFSVAGSVYDVESFIMSQAKSNGFVTDTDQQTRFLNEGVMFRNGEFMSLTTSDSSSSSVIADGIVSVNICFGKITD